jgi:hypothetical protein
MAIFRTIPNLLTAFLILLIAVVPTVLLAEEAEVISLSEPVAVSEGYAFYGATLPEDKTTISLGELIENSEGYLDKEVVVETRIAKVCQKKGCFFVATEGASTARITFKDYGFFIPTDSGGKDAKVLGVFSRVPVSQEQAEHYAADLGEAPAPDAIEYEYSIVASAVRLPRLQVN